jgi:threonine/homoserine/homoserine lactone efflux protein
MNMISFSNLILYTAGAMVIIISPGPDFIYVTTRGIAQGRLAGVLSAAGISIGLSIHTALAAFGLSTILNASNIAFQTIKYAGALYLIYLGVKAFLRKEDFAFAKDNQEFKKTSIIRQGILTNVFNPKAVITFMAFIPQFIDPQNRSAAVQIALLGGILAFLAVVWFSFVGLFAGALGAWMSKNTVYKKIIRWLASSILLGLGLRLALMKKNS